VSFVITFDPRDCLAQGCSGARETSTPGRMTLATHTTACAVEAYFPEQMRKLQQTYRRQICSRGGKTHRSARY